MKRMIGTDQITETDGTWSQATRIGKLLFISGQVPLDSDGRLVGENDFSLQAKQCLDNLIAMLEAGGAELKDLASITVFLTDMDNRKIFADVRKNYFQENPPASTVVEINRLFMDEILLEVNGIAVLE